MCASIAQDLGVGSLSIGSEFSSLERHDAHWRQLISSTRLQYDGQLIYSANWDHFDAVPFWDALDAAGVTGYFGLPSANRTDVEAAWAVHGAKLAALSVAIDRPVVLTEVGYPSRGSAALRPWDDGGLATPDLALQASLYESFFRAHASSRSFSGLFVWNWFGWGGGADAGYSPRGKPAAAVIKRHFSAWARAAG